MSTLEARFRGDLGRFRLDVEFSVPARGVTALFGHSGCGKTTVLRCVAGLDRMTEGNLTVGDQVWQDARTFLPPHRRRVGYVFQDANLFPHLSVRANLTYGHRRNKGGARTPDVDDVVELLGLPKLLDRSPLRLSGGERQRVAIGRALLSGPEVLLMDEPLAALDRFSKDEILPYLDRLHDHLAVPVLYVSHDIAEVERLADHMVLLEAGRVAATGPLTDVLTRLDLPFQQDEDAGVALEAEIAEIDPRWHLARAAFPGGGMWVRDPGLPVGRKVRLRILARDVSLARERIEGTSILNLMEATVTEVAPGKHPAVVLVRVDVGGSPLLARLTSRSADVLGLAPGRKIWAQIKSVAVLE